MESINIEEINRKNNAIAPGLTIVYWGDTNKEILNSFQIVKDDFKDFSKYIKWYLEGNIHSTISALTRTRYNQYFPFRANQLPTNLSKTISRIGDLKPIEIKINRYKLDRNGRIQFVVEVSKESEKNLQGFRNISKMIDPNFQYLDKPKSTNKMELHINLGYFSELPVKRIHPFEKEVPQKVITKISNVSIVHYLKRTLEERYIVGQIHVPLNQNIGIAKRKLP